MTNRRRSGRINLKVVIILVLVAGSLVGGAFLARYVRSRIISADALAEGNAAYEAGRWNDACKHFAEYLSRNPRDADIMAKYAEANLSIEPLKAANLGAAIDAYRRVLRVRPEREEAYVSLARLYRFTGDHAELGYTADRLLEHKPGDLRARLWKAQALAAQGKTAKAKAALGIGDGQPDAKPKYLEDVERQGRMHKEYVDACLLVVRLLSEDASSAPVSQKRRIDAVLEWAAAYAPDRALPYVARALDSIMRLADGSVRLKDLRATPREDLKSAGKRPSIGPQARLGLITGLLAFL